MESTAVVLIICPDRKGLVAGVAGLLYRYGANIVHADQHQDHDAGLFFMRVEWSLDGFDLEAFGTEFQVLAAEMQMAWHLELMEDRPRVAVFVSQYQHCLADILHRHQIGELRCDIPLIITNLVQVAFFLTPVMWPPHMLGRHVWILNFNPFYHFLEIVRAPILGEVMNPWSWPAAIVLTALGAMLLLAVFSRYRARVAYWV